MKSYRIPHYIISYTAFTTAAEKVNVLRKEQQRINRLSNKIDKMKPVFRRPDIVDRKYDLET